MYLLNIFSVLITIYYKPRSDGWLILPVTALAAATAGLARYISESTCPIRPTKFLLVVDTHLSPSARIPIYPPRHGPQVGVLTTAPALINVCTRPSSIAYFLCSWDNDYS